MGLVAMLERITDREAVYKTGKCAINSTPRFDPLTDRRLHKNWYKIPRFDPLTDRRPQ